MTSANIVLFDLVYKFSLGFITNSSIFDTLYSQSKFVLLGTMTLYCLYYSNVNYCNPLINNLSILIYTFIAWTSIIAYILPYLDVLSTMSHSFGGNIYQLFWYLWGYSFPCMLIYALVKSFGVDRQEAWKSLFL